MKEDLTDVTSLVIAIAVSESTRASDADGALVEPSVTEVLVRLHLNVVDSKPEALSTSLAQPISEQLTARDIPATESPRSAP